MSDTSITGVPPEDASLSVPANGFVRGQEFDPDLHADMIRVRWFKKSRRITIFLHAELTVTDPDILHWLEDAEQRFPTDTLEHGGPQNRSVHCSHRPTCPAFMGTKDICRCGFDDYFSMLAALLHEWCLKNRRYRLVSKWWGVTKCKD